MCLTVLTCALPPLVSMVLPINVFSPSNISTRRELCHHYCQKLCIFVPPQDSSQIGLLKELLDLQKDMVVMLLSLLEGKGLLGCFKFQTVCSSPSVAL